MNSGSAATIPAITRAGRAWLGGCALGALAFAGVANAQEAPPKSAEDSVQEAPLDNEIVVTAPRPRGSAIGEIEPIAVLDAEAIGALGAPSMSELLKRLRPLTSSATGGDPVFLLNGRRISGFQELQSLPPEALERTEILSEQDAARFGFPATVRVVNFVTRKRFHSFSVQQLAGTTTEGGGASNYAEAISTRIDGDRRTSFTVSHFRQNPVLQSQRGVVPDPDGLFAIGGNVSGLNGQGIDPTLDAIVGQPVRIAAVPADPAARSRLASYAATANAPAATDLGPYRSLQPRVDLVRMDGTIAAPIAKDVSASLNLSAEAQRVVSLNGLASAVLRVPASDPALPFGDDVLLYRYLPDTLLKQRNASLNLHAGGTVEGRVRRWNWNLTTSYDRVRSTGLSDQGVPLEALQAAIDAGGDPLAPLDPDIAAQRLRNRSRTLTTTLVSKAVTNGPLLRLPAGDAQVTVSADFARSTAESGEPGSSDASPLLTRSVRGASLNADLPIASADRGFLGFMGQLALNGTIGVSDVSGYGRLFNSNYGLSWTPLRGVQFTASVNQARTPPAVAMLASPVLTTPNTPFFDFTTGSSVLVTTVSGGNPDLAAERRRVMTLGVALKPFKDKELRVNLDYLDTRVANQAAYLGGLTPDLQSAFPDLFERGAGGELVRVDLRPVSIANESEQKLRMSVNLWTQIGRPPPAPAPAAGPPSKDAPPPEPPKPQPSLYAMVTTNWRLTDRLNLQQGSPSLDLLDGATLSGTGGRPRWEAEVTLGGAIDPVSFGVYGRVQGPTRVRSDLAASDLRFSGRTWLVLYGSLDAARVVDRPWARKLTLQLTVENLLNDQIEVRDRNGATPNRFQSAYLDPLGRSIRLGVRKLF